MTKAKGNIWKGIIMLVLGTVFMLPVFLIVMNSFKTGKEILTNFVSFSTSLYLDNFVQAMKTMRYASSFLNSAVLTVLTVFISLISRGPPDPRRRCAASRRAGRCRTVRSGPAARATT